MGFMNLTRHSYRARRLDIRRSRARRLLFPIASLLAALAVCSAVFVSIDPSPGAVSQVDEAYACFMPSGGPARVWAYGPDCKGGQVVHWAVKGVPKPTTSSTTKPTLTVPPTTTATTIVTTTTTGGAPAGHGRPPAGGYFQILPPGSALPSDATCATLVHRSTWEPRPGNTTYNHTVPPQPNTLGTYSDFNGIWNQQYKPRITGNFTGTTDEIIQWAACKWGWSDDWLRAQAVRESHWYQYGPDAEGDKESRSNGHCVYDISSDPCPTSFGFTQTKWYYHPDGVASNSPKSSYPWIRTSTAFSAESLLAQLRGCYDGLSSQSWNTKGQLAGCIGWWYSGGWNAGGGDYYTNSSNGVSAYYASKPWLSW